MTLAAFRTRDSFYSDKYKMHLSDADLKLEVLIHDAGAKVYVIGFKGKAIRPSFHYWFHDMAKAHAYAEKFLKDAQAAHAEKKKAKSELAIVLEAGDVLVSSWGYDQTNIDYYQVIERVGKCSVKLREIGKESVENERASMTGKCVPLPGQFTGDAFMRRVVNGHGVNISSFQYARKKEYATVEGVRVYQADSWTAYA